MAVIYHNPKASLKMEEGVLRTRHQRVHAAVGRHGPAPRRLAAGCRAAAADQRATPLLAAVLERAARTGEAPLHVPGHKASDLPARRLHVAL
jgi:hypothetical protein